MLQGRNENIKLIVLLIRTLAWSFHVWVEDKSINYTSFLHLTCSNQSFQTLSCAAQQWSWPPVFWGNHSTLGKHLSIFLIPIPICSDFSRFPFLQNSMVLEGLGCSVIPPTSHDHVIPGCALPPLRKPPSCRAHYRRTVLFREHLTKNKQTRKAFFFIFFMFLLLMMMILFSV